MLPKQSLELEKLDKLNAQVQSLRSEIVATKEGGAITGEECLREHTDQLYSALLSYEGRPGPYLLERIDVLQAKLTDIKARFAALMQENQPMLEGLKSKMSGAAGLWVDPTTAAELARFAPAGLESKLPGAAPH